MENYQLILSDINNEQIKLDLTIAEDDTITFDYTKDDVSKFVYNDHCYKISVYDDKNQNIYLNKAFVNHEEIDFREPSHYFLECFGVAHIEVVIDGIRYFTEAVSVKYKKDGLQANIVQMIDYISENCDDYLYEEHKYSKVPTGIKPNANVSIEARLAMVEDICETYKKCYHMFRQSAQSKLIAVDSVGPFHEMQSVQPNTIRYIVQHPEELQQVNFRTGIRHNKRNYQPRNTLIKTSDYSFDVYENRIVVGFLKTIWIGLDDMKHRILMAKNRSLLPKEKDGYVESMYFICQRNLKLLNDLLGKIEVRKREIEELIGVYVNFFKVKADTVSRQPRFTNIFRSIMPYRIVFGKISDWFNCGNYDLTKSDLLLSFVSVSKIYEYFCLIKINRTLTEMGFTKNDAYPFKYDKIGYYNNTRYNNTFEFSKDNVLLTVYFQPVIYGERRFGGRPNGIQLYRSTSIGDDGRKRHSCFYTPDYLIKISVEDKSCYYILDAKHSEIEKIKEHQLVKLTYKYLFSISTLQNGDHLAGLGILCGKHEENSTCEIHDVAKKIGRTIMPSANILSVTGLNASDNVVLEELLEQYVKVAKNIQGTNETITKAGNILSLAN